MNVTKSVSKLRSLLQRIIHIVDSDTEEELRNIIESLQRAGVTPTASNEKLRNKFSGLARFNAISELLLWVALLPALIAGAIGVIIVSFPISRTMMDLHFTFTLPNLIAYIVFSATIAYLISIPIRFFDNVKGEEHASSSSLPSIFYTAIWPLFIFYQLLPNTGLFSNLNILRVQSMIQFSLLKSNWLDLEASLSMANTTLLLLYLFIVFIFFSTILTISLRSRRKHNLFPESALLTELAEAIKILNFSVIEEEQIARKIYGVWPQISYRNTVSYHLSTVIEIIEGGLAKTLVNRDTDSQLNLRFKFQQMSQYFKNIREEVLIPKQNTLDTIIPDLKEGFNNLYHGNWDSLKREVKASTKSPFQNFILLSKSIFLLSIFIFFALFLHLIPGLLSLVDSSTVKTIQLASLITSLLYIIYLIDPNFSKISADIFKGIPGKK